RRLALDARTVGGGELRHRIVNLPVVAARADHEDHARLVAGADEDVLGSGRRVEEVPLLEPPFFPFDQQRALPRQHEEVLLLRLRVVAAGRLARWQDVDAYAELLELRVRRLERALGARRLQLPALACQPLGVADVDDEPGHQCGCQASGFAASSSIVAGSSPRARSAIVTCSSTARRFARTAIQTSRSRDAEPAYSTCSGPTPRTFAIGPPTARTTSATVISSAGRASQ